MSVLFVVVVVALVGGLNTLGTSINGKVGREVGVLRATYMFLGVGAVWALGLSYLLEDFSFGKLGEIPTYLFIPGVVNVIFIAAMIRIVNALGAMLTQGSIFAGQTLASLFLDHIGFAGLQTLPVSQGRIIGTGVLLLGVALLARTSGNLEGAQGVAPDGGDRETAGEESRRGWTVVGALVLGTAISTAMTLNASLGTLVGPLMSAGMFLLPGALLLGIYLLANRWLRFERSEQRSFSWTHVVPGTLNVAVVMASVVFIPVIGVQLVMGTTITAAVLTGLLVVDRLGLFGLPKQPITPRRVAAAVVLVAGVAISLMFGQA